MYQMQFLSATVIFSSLLYGYFLGWDNLPFFSNWLSFSSLVIGVTDYVRQNF